MEPITIDTPRGPVVFPANTDPLKIEELLAEEFAAGDYGQRGDTPIAEQMVQGGEKIGSSLGDYLDPATYTGEPEGFEGMGYGNPITAAANVVRPASEAAGTVAKLGWETWWNTYGRLFPGGAKDVVENGFSAMMSPVAEKWAEFKNDHPLEAQVLEDTGTASELTVPKLRPKLPAGTVRKSKRTVNTNIINERRKGIYGLVRKPKAKSDVRQYTEQPHALRSQEWTPDVDEQNMAMTLETIDSVKPDRSYTYNAEQVNKATLGWKDELWKVLGTHTRKPIPKQVVLERFQEIYQDLPNLKGYHMLSPDGRSALTSQLQEILKLVDSSGTKNTLKPRDLLKIRQQFDDLFEGTGGSLEQSVKNAKNVSARELRDEMNSLLREYTKDPRVYSLLDKQHEGLKALDILEPKVIKEQSNLFTRAFQKLKDVGHLPSTPLALYATGATAGALMGAPMAGAAAATVGVGMGAVKLLKAMRPAQRKLALAQIISAMDKAAKKDPSFSSLIAGERAAMIELMKATQGEEE